MPPDRGGTNQAHKNTVEAFSSYPLKDLEAGEGERGGESSGSDRYVTVNNSRHSDDERWDDDHSIDLPDYTKNPDQEESLLGHSVPSERRKRSRGNWPSPSWSSKTCRAGRFGSCIAGLGTWIRGPQPPRKFYIEPFFAHFQTAPVQLVDRFLPTRGARIWALVAFHALWAAVFLIILHRSVVGPKIPGYGTPARLSCGFRLWSNSTNCGLDGERCRPFDDASFVFRCPAGCLGTILLEPYTVGDQEINYQHLVVGGFSDAESGDAIYRGDSFICAAGMHAGVINDAAGGCGILRRTGERSNYGSVERNGISSISFPSNFPLSYTFDSKLESGKPIPACHDPRWLLFGISVFFTAVLALFTRSPSVFYGSVYFITYFQVALASDPPFSPEYDEIVSIGLGRFLPAAFVGYTIYYFCARQTLADLTAQYEKMILWLGPCWVGALNTDTFDKVPISRLTPHDLQQQPGAIPALIIIVAIVVTVTVSQAWAIRVEGRLPQYLLLYGVMTAGLLAMITVPQLNLRIHHYILALLFLPGTALQTRPSLVYQGLLVGLFINGIARWGFDSILQTPAALLADGQLGSLLPNIAIPIIHGNNISFSFPIIPDDVAGISVLVNDVERFHAYRAPEHEGNGAEPFHWSRRDEDVDAEYFRFGYMKMSSLGGVWYEDFTKAGVWQPDGGWMHMPPGPSR